MTGETARARSHGRWITAGLCVILVAVTTVAVERGLAWRESQAQQQERIEAVEAAEAEVLGLITISAATTNEDLETLIARATASFRDDLRAQEDRRREEVVANEVVATGEVVSSGVVEVEDDSAVVVVAARGTVDNRNSAAPEPRSYRLEVRLEQVDDTWLVSSLRFVA